MININWDEFKVFKTYSNKEDNFMILLDFIKSYYNMTTPVDIYDILKEDATGNQMLGKRKIVDAEGLEKYIFKV